MALAAGTQRISTRATGVVGVAILCSRVLGLIREVVFAAMFGASGNMDAFLTAFRAPNMLRDLFAEGALSTAFVTTFSRRIATEGEGSAWELATRVAILGSEPEIYFYAHRHAALGYIYMISPPPPCMRLQ